MNEKEPLENMGEYSRWREWQGKEQERAWQGGQKESQCDFSVVTRGIKTGRKQLKSPARMDHSSLAGHKRV